MDGLGLADVAAYAHSHANVDSHRDGDRTIGYAHANSDRQRAAHRDANLHAASNILAHADANGNARHTN